MKLTIFGATGATGQQLIEYALAAENYVVAYARNPSKISTSHERLTIMSGELTDAAAIERAVSGADAVISVLGPRPREDSSSKPITRDTEHPGSHAQDRCTPADYFIHPEQQGSKRPAGFQIQGFGCNG